MVRIRWTRQAVGDLNALGPVVRDRILARVELLGEFPHMGAAMDGAFEGFRQIVVGRHRVIYEADDDEVRIAYIRHGARQLGLRIVHDPD